jgi:prepilin-type N-terminal cleavage/methylation domain-containing protein
VCIVTTDRVLRRRIASQSGFTLIEVMVAMIILAVGLLGLQALGIGAIRAVHQGQKNTEFAVVAASHLEQAAHEVRRGCLVATESGNEVQHDEVVVVTRRITASGDLREITIQVAPSPGRQHVDPTPFTLSSHARVTGGDDDC